MKLGCHYRYIKYIALCVSLNCIILRLYWYARRNRRRHCSRSSVPGVGAKHGNAKKLHQWETKQFFNQENSTRKMLPKKHANKELPAGKPHPRNFLPRHFHLGNSTQKENKQSLARKLLLKNSTRENPPEEGK